MAHRKSRIVRLFGWIVLAFLSIVLLITLSFYLGRGWIMKKAVEYVNDNQPGELRMGQMNLVPFMSFPDVALQLRNVSYYESKVLKDSLYQVPILSLNEVYVSLDVIDLIKKDIKVSQARFEDGFIRIEVYDDSTMNLEKALGIRFGQETDKDSMAGLPSIQVDLERIQLSNILVLADDQVSDDILRVNVNSLESRFNYLPDHIEAGVKLDIDIDELKYLTFDLSTERNIQFESDVIVDPVSKLINMASSSLSFSGLELESSGSYSYLAEPEVDIEFRANNEGLDLLNFIFMGVLDLDEIEQIGSGSIIFEGSVKGSLGEHLPVVSLNGTAEDIGFRIKSIGKDVTDISFRMFASNGRKLDLSEGLLRIEDFSARFPDGHISASVLAKNFISPEVNIELLGNIDLAGLEQMIQSETLSDLSGNVKVNGKINGTVNRSTGAFLNDAGTMNAILSEVGFVMNKDTISNISGEVYLSGNVIGSDSLNFEFNKNRLALGARFENVLLYVLDFDTDVKAEISVASDILYPATIFRDTSITSILGEELRGLRFSAGAQIQHNDLDAYLKQDSVPTVEISLDSFGIELPVYADISQMTASMSVGPDTLLLRYLNGMIGESDFSFSGTISNIGAFTGQDSAAEMEITYHLSSEMMRAEDFFTYNDEFLFPEAYQTEYLEGLHLAGSVKLPVSGLRADSISPDFDLNVTDLGWNFRYYPLTFENFLIRLRREGDQLIIDEFNGKIGESNLEMTANLRNFTDTLTENLSGSLALKSDLLDFNELLNYNLPEEMHDSAGMDTFELREPPRLDQIDYPQFNLELDIGELRYGENRIYGMNGKLRSTRDKIFYMDHLVTSGESGGQIEFNGQFNVANPGFYTFSVELDLDKVNINDLDFEMQSGEETYTLKDNFEGVVTATGLAEIFVTPDLKFDMANTTAIFNMKVTDGALIRFTPLEAAGKYLDNRDLEYVKFATLRNSFTLMDSRVIIPLMNVESTIGQLLIEGEQGLDNSYLYLLRVPTWLVKGAAKSALTGSGDDAEADQIQEMKLGKFLRLTAWGDGDNSEVKLGDKREKYLE